MAETIMVTWITTAGADIEAQVRVGVNLMEAALSNNVPGIHGECGGALACATCHVVVEHSPVVLEKIQPTEDEMLEFAEAPRVAGSRLSCQMKAVKALDGLVLRVPG